MNTALAMLAVLGAWIATFVVQAGIGVGLLSLVTRRRSVGTVINGFWLGLVAVIGFLQLYQLIFPIGAAAVIVLTVSGGIGWVVFSIRCRASDELRVEPRWHRAVPIVLTAGAAIWFLNEAVSIPSHYDAGLYHLQTMQWYQHFHIVPGLANLHDRLAFNSSFLLYDALLSAGPWGFHGGHVGNSLLLVVLLFDLLRRARPLLAREPSMVAVVACLLLPAVFIRAHDLLEMSSPSLDLPAFVVCAAAIVRVLTWAETPRDDGASLGREEAACALALFAVLPTARVQLVPLAITGVLLLALRWPRRVGLRLAVLLSPLLLVIPSVVRSVIMSGYPAFPIAALPLPVSWRVPRAAVVATADSIRGFARSPGPGFRSAEHGWAWLGSWWAGQSHNYDLRWPLVLLAIGLVGAAAVAVIRRRGDAGPWRPSRPMTVGAVLWLGCLVTLVGWFVAAPTPRFALGPLWGIGALTVAAAITMLPSQWKPSAALAVVVLALALIASPLLDVLRVHNVYRGAPNTAGHVEPDPQVQTATVPIPGGEIRMPVGTDQCWDAPIPCTPEHAAGLRFRHAGDLGAGFEVRP